MASIGGEEGGVMVEGGNLIATEVNCPIEHLQFVSVRFFKALCTVGHVTAKLVCATQIG